MHLLPHLDEIVYTDPLWAFRDGDGHAGAVLLRVWRAGPGHFAVFTVLDGGQAVTAAASAIREVLVGQYGEPLTLAEHWPASQAPREHVDLALPPGLLGGGQSWSPLWPVPKDAPHAEVKTAWWLAYGPEILDIPG
jgi:hypothetical protein